MKASAAQQTWGLVPMYRVTLVREAPIMTERPIVTGPEAVADIVRPMIADSPVEKAVAAMLDTAGRVIGVEVISMGGLSSAVVEPRAVFRSAILVNAAAVVLAHNHPSGNREPSAEDVAITRQLVGAGRVLSIPLRDHIILTNAPGYTSLAERGAI